MSPSWGQGKKSEPAWLVEVAQRSATPSWARTGGPCGSSPPGAGDCIVTANDVLGAGDEAKAVEKCPKPFLAHG